MQKDLKNSNKAFIIGVGMTKFLKPGSHEFNYYDLGRQAGERALMDSGISYDQIEQGYVGYIFESSCAGQRVLYELGMTGIPVVNVNNNCATGSTAFYLGVNAIKSGQAECVISLGFDKMKKGPLPMEVSSPSHPVFKYAEPLILNNKLNTKVPPTPQIFGAAGQEHMDKYGTKFSHLCKISEKNYKHGFNNPYAQFRKIYSLKEVEASPMISYPLNKLQCCPTSDGAACVIIASEEFVIKHNLQNQAIEVLSCNLGSDKADTFDTKSSIDLIGAKLAKRVVTKAYQNAGITANDINVVELHDCFSANELVTYESLGLCPEGKAGDFIDKGDNTYGGKYVVNPSGGLTSKGHPLGATGLAQISELTWQLRRMSEKRQVENAKYALAHNLGLGSAVVISILKKFNDNYEKKTHHTSDPVKLEQIEKERKTKISANKLRAKF
jgi:acetyl-CoA acetyltransferase